MKTVLLSRMWIVMIILAVVAALTATVFYGSNRNTLTFKTDYDIDTISFDPSVISEAKLRQLILLSPFIVTYLNSIPARDFSAAGARKGTEVDKSFIALPLELCMAGDSAYSHCEDNGISGPNLLRNAKVNLEKGKRGLAWLARLDYPAELTPVVTFLEKSLERSVWVEETRFEYYSTWDENALKKTHTGIDPESSCPGIFSQLQTASKEEKYRIVRFDWANCIVKTIDRQLGPYPSGAWNAFLKAYRITEEHKELAPD